MSRVKTKQEFKPILNEIENPVVFDQFKVDVKKEQRELINQNNINLRNEFVDLEDCIKITFDEAKSMFCKEVHASKLKNAGKKFEKIIEVKKCEQNPFEEAFGAIKTCRLSHFEKVLRKSQIEANHEANAFLKLFNKISAEEKSVQNISEIL